MQYFCGTDSKKINKLYIYHGEKEKKIHIHGEFIRYLYYHNVEYLKIAYCESDPHIVYFIPKLPGEPTEKERGRNSSKKITYQENKSLSGSISCRAFVDEFKIPKNQNDDNTYSGHIIRYFVYNFDDDRKAISFNLNDIEGWKI